MVSDHSCKRPDVAIMDHRLGDRFDSRPMVNRVCLTCLTHWYGDAETAVFEIPGKVWDGWMQSGMKARQALTGEAGGA